MKFFSLSVFHILTALPVLVYSQSPSCYITTTILFGDPQSILSSLSMISNITETISTAFASTPASLLPPSSSTTSTGPLTSSTAPNLFRIEVDVAVLGRLRQRTFTYEPYYIAIEKDQAILVSEVPEATIFDLQFGYLKTDEGGYVGASTNTGTTQCELSSVPPVVGQGWSTTANGSLTLSGSKSFCYKPDNTLFISFEAPPDNCTVADLAVVPAPAAASSSISSQIVGSSSLFQIITSAPSPLTTNGLNSISTFGSSSALASTSSSLGLGESTIKAASSSQASTPTSSASTNSAVIVGSSTKSGAAPSSVSTSTTSTLAPSSGSNSVLATPTFLTNIVGPGQLSTQITGIYSLPFSVSSVSIPGSSTSATSSTLPFSVSSVAIPASSTPATSSVLTSSSGSSSASSSRQITSNTLSSSSLGSAFLSSSITSTTPSPSPSSISSSSTTIISSSSSSSTSPVPSVPSPYQRNMGKRGLVYTNVTMTQYYSLLTQNSLVSWAYDYASYPNASNNAGPVNPALTFIPLLFNDSPGATSIWSANANYSIAHYGTDALFSFNEPDVGYTYQSANMNVSRSVAAYQAFMQPFAGSVKLGAPAVTNSGPPAGLTYLSYFLGNCTGCTVDFINLHWYASPYSFSYLQSYIQQAYQVGQGRPIYLTEMGMDSVYYSESAVQAFLRNATTWLDAQSYVTRYAWFGDFAQSGPASQQGYGFLVNNGSTGLSAEGVIWNNYTGGYVPCPGTSC